MSLQFETRAWILFAATLTLGLVVSLCLVLHGGSSPGRPSSAPAPPRFFAQPVLHAPAAQQAEIPPDVSYTIISTDEIAGDGRRLEVRIDKIVSKDVLHAISMRLKSAEARAFQRTFMFYYLPGMVPGNGAWATAVFDPDLDVRILGFTAEQVAAFAAPVPADQERIGRWVFNFPASSCEITICRSNGKLIMSRRFQDGSIGEITLTEMQAPLGRQFKDIEGSGIGDKFVITPDGDLQIRDDTRLVGVAKAIK